MSALVLSEEIPAGEDLDLSRIEELKAKIDEQYFQLKLLPSLTFSQRQELYARFDSRNQLLLLQKIRKVQEQGDFLQKQFLKKLEDRLIELLLLMDMEEAEQIRLGIHHGYGRRHQDQIKIWKQELLRSLVAMSLPKAVEQKLSLSLLSMDGSKTQGLPESKEDLKPKSDLPEYSLEQLFFEIFATNPINKKALFEFMQAGESRRLDFLELKLEGTEEEKRRCLELVRFIPDKRSIILIGRAYYHHHSVVGERPRQILEQLLVQPEFQKFRKSIEFLLQRLGGFAQLKKSEAIQSTRNPVYLSYDALQGLGQEQARLQILKKLESEGLAIHQEFLLEIFTREEALPLRNFLLHSIARGRIESLYSLFRQALGSKQERLVYHAITYIREYSLHELLDDLKAHLADYGAFNRKFAEQVLFYLS